MNDPGATVLVVDDEPQIVRALRINLNARGYKVITAHDGTAALKAVAETKPDVVVLDLGLPDLDGTEVIAGLRGWTTVPIIVLSARGDSADKVQALDAGADDYVTKPFGMDELLARLRAAVRRAAVTGADDVDAVVETVVVQRGPGGEEGPPHDGAEVHLTKTEWGVLELLVRNRGRLVAQKQLLHEVWGPSYERSPTTCGCTSPSCGASWSRSPRGPGTCSPSRAWVTASRSEEAGNSFR